ncbi:hypothetical protein [Sphingomonas sp. PAMC 26617]|uniref:hypothetical protein n=1 Tax=Sphingomonas sp. PAMC 26617 TaxID=1112216 RepID=UPI0012F5249D|nr:hypothetical protein [Sphingomonas sp. PAMC 26617]
MQTLFFAILAASAVLTSQSKAADVPRVVCDVPPVEYVGELQSKLSQRAVHAINLAASSDGKSTAALERLIDPSASFSSGAGDVGLPLASGVAGAIALAREMKADTFRFVGWDGIPTPVNDRCGEQKVDIEFTDTHDGNFFPVTFTFKSGRIVAAQGWRRSFQSGHITAARQ